MLSEYDDDIVLYLFGVFTCHCIYEKYAAIRNALSKTYVFCFEYDFHLIDQRRKGIKG